MSPVVTPCGVMVMENLQLVNKMVTSFDVHGFSCHRLCLIVE